MSKDQDITEADNWFIAEDQNLEVPVRDKPGDPVDVAGWTIQFRMAVTRGGTSVLTKSGTVIAQDRARFVFLAADTSGLAARNYFYTVSRTDTGLNQVLIDARAHLQTRVQ